MKKIIMFSALFTILAWGCKKNSDVNNVEADPGLQKPTASFRINNLVTDGVILEGNISDFTNQSANAVSYHWDFGNGITSEERVPQNITFIPCGGNYVISLVVTNKSGLTDRYSETYKIMCRGKVAHRSGVIAPIHISSSQIVAAGYSTSKIHP